MNMPTCPAKPTSAHVPAQASTYNGAKQTTNIASLPEKVAVITPVILCGGSGTRLWPLSRKSFPKQFVPLIDGKSLLQLTLKRVAQVNLGIAATQAICVAAEDHRFLVEDALKVEGLHGQIILEPAGRNTAPAMALAALSVQVDDLLLFCPADHHIPDTTAFATMVQKGRSAAEKGAIVTFGIMPSFPSSAFGYIQQGLLRDDSSHAVARFIEKPDAATAQALILQGSVLWNEAFSYAGPTRCSMRWSSMRPIF